MFRDGFRTREYGEEEFTSPKERSISPTESAAPPHVHFMIHKT